MANNEFAYVMTVLVVVAVGAAIWYVIGSALRFMLFRRVGHLLAWSAWIPVWRSASLLEIAGFRRPWVWAVVPLALREVLGLNVDGKPSMFEFIIWVVWLLLAVYVAVWTAFGVQSGLQVPKGAANGWGTALMVFVPWAWLIWMIVRAGNREFDRVGAAEAGRMFPFTATQKTPVRSPVWTGDPCPGQGPQGPSAPTEPGPNDVGPSDKNLW